MSVHGDVARAWVWGHQAFSASSTFAPCVPFSSAACEPYGRRTTERCWYGRFEINSCRARRQDCREACCSSPHVAGSPLVKLVPVLSKGRATSPYPINKPLLLAKEDLDTQEWSKRKSH